MKNRRILVSPLNWGFGHTGRMIPLALELSKRGNEVIFAVDAGQFETVKKELPGIRVIILPGIRISYSRNIPAFLSILFRIPHIIAFSIAEHFRLRKIAEEYKPDVIISDNRFGFFHKKVFSVYVTHMLRIPFPEPFRFLEFIGVWLHRMIIHRYDLCMVPDFQLPPDISGSMSHGTKLPGNIIYAGPLSRFRNSVSLPSGFAVKQPYLCLILSGPEPHCSELMHAVIEASSDRHLVILSNRDYRQHIPDSERITFVCNPDTKTMREIITESSMIICRSGYTTLMELISLRKSAVLIPTPGQTEQEYLAKYHGNGKAFITFKHQEIPDMEVMEARYAGLTPPSFPDSSDMFENALDILSEKEK